MSFPFPQAHLSPLRMRENFKHTQGSPEKPTMVRFCNDNSSCYASLASGSHSPPRLASSPCSFAGVFGGLLTVVHCLLPQRAGKIEGLYLNEQIDQHLAPCK